MQTETDRIIRVLCVDDHALMREGIASTINRQPDMTVVAEGESGREAFAKFLEHRPDITLLDIQMDDVSGLDALAAILREQSDAKVIILTTYKGDALASRALRTGAKGYLLKSMLRKELTDVIRIVHKGGRYVPAEIALAIADNSDLANLTPREVDVLRLVASGYSNKIAADALKVSEETVKGHMRTIMQKLSARDRTHAVTIAVKRGFLEG